MNGAEFQEIAVSSAKQYYEYLESYGKGVSRIEVNKIVKKDELFALHINHKIIYDEAINFEIRGKVYTAYQIKIVEYDPDKNILIINPLQELKKLVDICKAEEIIILSDLKFLVKRVEDWYRKFGTRIRIPNAVNENPNFSDFDDLHPSIEQVNAIHQALSQSFTYIWGAPGTGKTQIVLASCIRSYINRNEKIIIVAPTNNAIEQVLYSVMPVLDGAGIPRDTILRLGTPTKKFAKKYPEICEEAGLQRYLNEISNHINLLKKAVLVKNFEDTLFSLSTGILPLMYSLINNIESYNIVLLEAKEARDLLEIKNRMLSLKQKEVKSIINQLDQLLIKEGSLSFRIKSGFSQSTRQEFDLEKHRIQQTLDQLNNELKNMKFETDRQRLLVNQLSQLSDDTASIEKSIEEIKSSATMISPKLSRITESLCLYNATNILRKLEEKLAEGHNYIKAHEIEVEQYASDNKESLLLMISKLEDEYKDVSRRGTKNRINNANCIACTIDGYISRFTFYKEEENDYKYSISPKHIFMDEAGYSSLIKGITLTAHHCPVTFIGDHLQLPPVCEMDDSDLKKKKNTAVSLWAQSVLYIEDAFSKTIEEIRDDYLNGTNITFKHLLKCNLTGTFRFGSRLAKTLDEFVYKNGFTSFKENDDFEIVILDARRKTDRARRTNIAEIDAISDFIQSENPEDYAILSPYKNQVKLIGQRFPDLRKNAQIMTVHGSQGREWDTVILSVSDTDDAWFTDSQNTESKGLMVLNTAISRAKKRLVIACDAVFWRQQQKQLIGPLVTENLIEVDM